MAAAGQKALYKAWDLLDEIYKEAELKTPFAKFLGQAGCSTVNQLNQHLKNKYLRFKAGLSEN